MRDRFIWSLISAVGIFFLGAGASVIHGIHTLSADHHIEGAGWSYLGESVEGWGPGRGALPVYGGKRGVVLLG